MEKCIHCHEEKEKLFKDGTCSHKCHRGFLNKVLKELRKDGNSSHNFINNNPNKQKIECTKCSRLIAKTGYKAHVNCCRGKINCLNCGIEFFDRIKKFCTSSCSASYNNIHRNCNLHSIGQEKSCETCFNLFVTTGYSQTCKQCKKDKIEQRREDSKVIKTCDFCTNEFKTKSLTRNWCSSKCRTLTAGWTAQCRKAGQAAAKVLQNVRRSKNEIYFSELCEKEFKNVLINERIFNGWDADVVLSDYKLAIHWNGAWHYKKLFPGHNLENIQNRDKIKYNEVTKFGYVNYIIIDENSKLNKEFVEEEFLKLKKELQTNVTP